MNDNPFLLVSKCVSAHGDVVMAMGDAIAVFNEGALPEARHHVVRGCVMSPPETKSYALNPVLLLQLTTPQQACRLMMSSCSYGRVGIFILFV